jgi:hypothetical protein
LFFASRILRAKEHTMIEHLRPACLAAALVVTAGPALAQTWVYEPDVGARVVYQPRVYQPRYVTPVYNAYAYQPVVTAPAVTLGPTQRTVVSRTVIPRRNRAPIVKERIVSETYGPAIRRPAVVEYAPRAAAAAYAYAPPVAAAYAYAPAVTSAYAYAPVPRPVVTRPAVVEYAPSVTSAYAYAPIARPVVAVPAAPVVSSYGYYDRSLLLDPVTGRFLEDY